MSDASSRCIQGLAALALLAAVTGCSDATEAPPEAARGAAGGAGGGTFDLGGRGGEPGGIGGSCGGDSYPAKVAPLDLVLLIDRSASMNARIAGGATKWSAVGAAVREFLSAAGQQELSAELLAFPAFHAGVPASCTATAECNGFGPCRAPGLCSNHYQAGRSVSCKTDDDCAEGDDRGSCWPLGHCGGDANLECLPELGNVCRDGVLDCVRVPSVCEARASCDASDHARPIVPMQPRLAAAPATATWFATTTPEGGTPTGPALAGALENAKAWRAAHSGHEVALLLVTDGMPTDCMPLDVPSLASLTAAESSVIRTFVVGVFDEELAAPAQQNLDALARAGGTDHAFIVTTGTNAARDLANALAAARVPRVPCEYALPVPTTGDLDLQLVNVDAASGGGAAVRLPRVDDEAGCAGLAGGWYYDRALESDPPPTSVRLCPATCAGVQGDAQASVKVILGCPTVVPR